MRYKRGPPAVADFPAVRQKLEIPLDHAGQAIRLGDAQTDPFLSSGRVEAFQNSRKRRRTFSLSSWCRCVTEGGEVHSLDVIGLLTKNQLSKRSGGAPGMCAVECAVRFEPVCANMGFFDTSVERFRTGLVVGK